MDLVKTTKKKILILSNHFITLYSFRRELISCLAVDGHDVYISMPADPQNKFFLDMGCFIIETPMERRGRNPIKDIELVFRYRKIINDIQPDIIFSYTVKPNIYGSIASNLLCYKQVCNITGTGATFLKESILSKIVRMLYRISVKKTYKVFFQNTGDRDYFLKHKMIGENYAMLPGSGVNLKQHIFSNMPQDDIVNFIFIGRVMRVKGIDQYLDCAKIITQQHKNVHFYIAGWNEEEKYKKVIDDYQKHGFVEYVGFQENIDMWIRKCHCTILPSLGGEGVPNVLLESAASGRACIASFINGSKDVIVEGKTGYLYEPGNSQELVKKVGKFLGLSFEEKKAMGIAGHEMVAKKFNRQFIVDKYLDEVKKI